MGNQMHSNKCGIERNITTQSITAVTLGDTDGGGKGPKLLMSDDFRVTRCTVINVQFKETLVNQIIEYYNICNN